MKIQYLSVKRSTDDMSHCTIEVELSRNDMESIQDWLYNGRDLKLVPSSTPEPVVIPKGTKLRESCPCGSEIEVSYAACTIAEIAEWRSRHTICLLDVKVEKPAVRPSARRSAPLGC